MIVLINNRFLKKPLILFKIRDMSIKRFFKAAWLSLAMIMLPALAFANRGAIVSSHVTESEWKEAISSSLSDPLTSYKNNLRSCEKDIITTNYRSGQETETKVMYDFNSDTQLSQITVIQMQDGVEVKAEYTYFPVSENDKFISGYVRYFRKNVPGGGEWFCTNKTDQRKPEIFYRSKTNDQFIHYNSFGIAKWINMDMDGESISGYVITNETKASGMTYSDFFMFVFDDQKRLEKFITEIKAMDDYTRTAMAINYTTPDIKFPVSLQSIQQAATCSFFDNDEFKRKFVTYFMESKR